MSEEKWIELDAALRHAFSCASEDADGIITHMAEKFPADESTPFRQARVLAVFQMANFSLEQTRTWLAVLMEQLVTARMAK